MPSKLIEQYAHLPTLKERGIQLPADEARPLNGLIEYTNLSTAIANYKEDSHSTKKLEFIAKAYGCDSEALLHDAGMDRVLQAFREGRMISAVKSHALLVDAYNLTDVIMAGLVSQELGIPTAIMAMSYSDDQYISSPEKSTLFGSQRFFTGYTEKEDKKGQTIRTPSFTAVTIQPAEIRTYSSDGTPQYTPIDNVDNAVGVPLKDIMVTITDPVDQRGAKAEIQEQSFLEVALGMSIVSIMNHTALGVDRATGKMNLAGLHKVLFESTIARLRTQGYLPSEEEMPVIYCELGDLSKSILKHATHVPETVQTLQFEGPVEDLLLDTLHVEPTAIALAAEYLNTMDTQTGEQLAEQLALHNGQAEQSVKDAIRENYDEETLQQILRFVMTEKGLRFHERSGLLARGENADPASYYPLFQSLLHHDYCTLDGADVDSYFMEKVHRAQKLQKKHGLATSIIRTPTDEVTAKDNNGLIHPFVDVRIHPSGRHFNIKTGQGEISKEFMELQKEIDALLVNSRIDPKKPLSRDALGAGTAVTAKVKIDHTAALLKRIRNSMQTVKIAEFPSLPNDPAVNPEGRWYAQRIQAADLEIITDVIAMDEVTCWWLAMIANATAAIEKDV